MDPKLPDILEVDLGGFERLIGTYINKMGFDIDSMEETADGDIHYIAKTSNPMGGKLVSLIRAGPYGSLIDRPLIEELYTDMIDKGAVRSAFITTSDFTEEAVDYARGKPISLINKYELIESLRRSGVAIDAEFLELLERHGLAEERFRGEKHTFEIGLLEDAAVEYFAKRAKSKRFGLFGVAEKLEGVEKRYAPVGVFKATRSERVERKGGSMTKVEKEDYVFINLNNLDWYFLLKKRGGKTPYCLNHSDILADIEFLPDGAREHLMDLLDHGDLPHEHLAGKNLEILKSKGIVTAYNPSSRFPKSETLRDISRLMVYVSEELLDLVRIFLVDLFSESSGDYSHSLHSGEGDEGGESHVMASVNLPHLKGGVYNIRPFLSVQRGMAFTDKGDDVNYSSKHVASILSSVLQAKIESQGLVFMPYYSASYSSDNYGRRLRREILLSPLFITEDKPKTVKKKKVEEIVESGVITGLPYKIIR